MKNAKELLAQYVEQAEKIIIEFNYNEETAVRLLEELKAALEKKQSVSSEEKELFDACTYNALATINTSFEQGRKNNQLLAAITESKEEMKAIMELL